MKSVLLSWCNARISTLFERFTIRYIASQQLVGYGSWGRTHVKSQTVIRTPWYSTSANIKSFQPTQIIHWSVMFHHYFLLYRKRYQPTNQHGNCSKTRPKRRYEKYKRSCSLKVIYWLVFLFLLHRPSPSYVKQMHKATTLPRILLLWPWKVYTKNAP